MRRRKSGHFELQLSSYGLKGCVVTLRGAATAMAIGGFAMACSSSGEEDNGVGGANGEGGAGGGSTGATTTSTTSTTATSTTSTTSATATSTTSTTSAATSATTGSGQGGAGGAGGEGGQTSASGGGGSAGICAAGSTQSCYSGPMGTLGIGACAAGVATCAADGMSYDPCVAETIPTAETCGDSIDQDCDGSDLLCAPGALWSKRYGDAADQRAFGVTTDAAGNIVVTGRAAGTVDYGGGPLMAASPQDIFVVKLDPSGAHLWSKTFGKAGKSEGGDVAIDSAGNVLLTGRMGGVISFGGTTLTTAGGNDIVVAKLDSSGTAVWSKRFGDAADQAGLAIAVKSSGNVVVAGWMFGTVTLGGGAPVTSAGGRDIFMMELNAAGNFVRRASFGNINDDQANDVAVDAQDNVFLAGSFQGSADFGGGTLVSGGGIDGFVAKYDAAGNHLWSKRFGDAADQGAVGVSTDTAGNAVVVGTFKGSVDFGAGPLTSAGDYDVFVVKLDPSGNVLWNVRYGDAAAQNAGGISVDAQGNASIGGWFAGTIGIGATPLVSAGGIDAFTAKLDPSGSPIWSQRAGDGLDQVANDVALDASGNTIAVGDFAGSIDFGSGTLVSAGTRDAFVTKRGP